MQRARKSNKLYTLLQHEQRRFVRLTGRALFLLVEAKLTKQQRNKTIDQQECYQVPSQDSYLGLNQKRVLQKWQKLSTERLVQYASMDLSSAKKVNHRVE